MGQIDDDTLMPLQTWCVYRQDQRRKLLAHCRARSLRLGPHWQLQFEDELTVRLQLQEQLRQQPTRPAANPASTPPAWARRIPDGTEWTATLRVIDPDPATRHALQPLLDAALPQLYVEVARLPRAYAQTVPAESDSSPADRRTQLLRFALSQSCREAVLAECEVRLGCDHPHYHWRRSLPAHTLERLRRDLVLPGRVAPSPGWPGALS